MMVLRPQKGIYCFLMLFDFIWLGCSQLHKLSLDNQCVKGGELITAVHVGTSR